MNTSTSLWEALFGKNNTTPTVGVSVSLDKESLSQLAAALVAAGLILIILNRLAHKWIKA